MSVLTEEVRITRSAAAEHGWLTALRGEITYLQSYARRVWPEKAAFCIAHNLPAKLRYFTFVSVAADATTDDRLVDQEVPGIHLDDLLRVVHSREVNGDRRTTWAGDREEEEQS